MNLTCKHIMIDFKKGLNLYDKLVFNHESVT